MAERQDHPQAHGHWAAAQMASAVHERIASSHSARDPDIQTATIDEQGALSLTQSTIRIPVDGYSIAPHVGDIGTGDVVVVLWADRDMNRHPYVIANLSGSAIEIGVIQSDGLHLTERGIVVSVYHISSTANDAWKSSHLGADIPNGTGVVIVWAGYGASREPYVIACL